MSSHTILAASFAGSLILVIVGVLIVLALVGILHWRRRSARRISTPPTGRNLPGEGQRGDTWQTPDDDPDQGRPHP